MANYAEIKIMMMALMLIAAGCKSNTESAVADEPGSPSSASISDEDNGQAASVNDSIAAFTYKIIDAPEGTFGYDILMNGKVMIHQPNIPGMPGLKGFINKEDAAKVADLVIGKLKNNQMPPTVTTEELEDIMAEE